MSKLSARKRRVRSGNLSPWRTRTRLQPILAILPRAISQAALSGDARDARERANVVDAIKQQASKAEERGFDIDAVTEEDSPCPRDHYHWSPWMICGQDHQFIRPDAARHDRTPAGDH